MGSTRSIVVYFMPIPQVPPAPPSPYPLAGGMTVPPPTLGGGGIFAQ